MPSIAALLDRAEALERVDPGGTLRLAEEALRRCAEASESTARCALEARAFLRAARASTMLGRTEAALHHCTEGRDRARRANRPDLESALCTIEGRAFSELGHLPAALESFDEGLRLAGEHGVPTVERMRASLERAGALRRHGQLLAAAEAYDAVLSERGTLEPALEATLCLNAASAYWQLGRAHEAQALLEDVRALCEARRVAGLEVWRRSLEAWVALALGDVALALEAGRWVSAQSWEASDFGALTSGFRAFAKALVARGDGEALLEAERVLEEALQRQRERGAAGTELATLHEELAEVHTHLGRHEDAAAQLRHAFHSVVQTQRDHALVLARAEKRRLELARLEIEAHVLRVRNRDLAALGERLERVSAERARLLATVAHDLRTPLTALGCSLDLYREEPSQVEHLVETVDHAVQRMRSIIDATLSVEAILSGRVSVRPERVDVGDVVRRLLAGLAPLAVRKRIAVELVAPESTAWETDPTAFGRIVENLVSNALKFSPAGGRVTIRLEVSEATLALTVHDSGPGFRDEDLASLFQLGRTASARPTFGESSSGVGLHVVHGLVTALGGEVAVRNAPDGGALVEVRLGELSRAGGGVAA